MRLLKCQTMLKDAVYNIALDSGASDDYAQGIVVGAVAALMATGMSFKDALTHVAIVSPEPLKMRPTLKLVPQSWAADYIQEYLSSHSFTV